MTQKFHGNRIFISRMLNRNPKRLSAEVFSSAQKQPKQNASSQNCEENDSTTLRNTREKPLLAGYVYVYRLNTKIRLTILCLSGFELYFRWVPTDICDHLTVKYAGPFAGIIKVAYLKVCENIHRFLTIKRTETPENTRYRKHCSCKRTAQIDLLCGNPESFVGKKRSRRECFQTVWN